MKKVFLLLSVTMLLFACGNEANNEATENKEASKQEKEQSTTTLKAHELLEEGEKYVGETVTVEGTAVHVCQHGGKRMFLNSGNSDERLKAVANEELGNFKTEDEGNTFLVTGTVEEQRIDNEYLDNWEQEIKDDLGDDHTIHDGDHGEGDSHDDHTKNEDLAKVENMRKEIEESEKDYLSIFSLKAESYKKK